MRSTLPLTDGSGTNGRRTLTLLWSLRKGKGGRKEIGEKGKEGGGEKKEAVAKLFERRVERRLCNRSLGATLVPKTAEEAREGEKEGGGSQRALLIPPPVSLFPPLFRSRHTFSCLSPFPDPKRLPVYFCGFVMSREKGESGRPGRDRDVFKSLNPFFLGEKEQGLLFFLPSHDGDGDQSEECGGNKRVACGETTLIFANKLTPSAASIRHILLQKKAGKELLAHLFSPPVFQRPSSFFARKKEREALAFFFVLQGIAWQRPLGEGMSVATFCFLLTGLSFFPSLFLFLFSPRSPKRRRQNPEAKIDRLDLT